MQQGNVIDVRQSNFAAISGCSSQRLPVSQMDQQKAKQGLRRINFSLAGKGAEFKAFAAQPAGKKLKRISQSSSVCSGFIVKRI